jgi:RNA polymerase sigma factor
LFLMLFNKFMRNRESVPAHMNDAVSPEHYVMRIQNGDLKLRNQFITNYQPYVIKVTSRFSKRYVDPARDDEFSIALSAFNEAVNQFSPESGRSFLSFAETVIRRRLIDYVRKEQRFQSQVPYSAFDQTDEEENSFNPIDVHQAMEQYGKQKSMEERQGEIIELNRCLANYGISFADLADASPRHSDSRQMLFKIGKKLADNSALMRILLTKRQLPIKEMLDIIDISRKTLERNRKFLIAIALIYNGPYPYLRDYLHIEDVPTEERKLGHE